MTNPENPRMQPRPFEGIKIVDTSHVLAGPFAAYQLALLGADVIKVEDPNEVDQSRYMGVDKKLNAELMGTNFLTQGSNKRSITLNLKTEAGRDILKKLVADADVMIENYRVGAFQALGLGYADMKAINPNLIYCSMTGYGQTGPRAHHTVYDHLIQANSGLMVMTGTPETAPVKTGTQVLDFSTGLMAAFAISGALYQRTHTGRGQYVDVSMLDTAMILIASHLTGYFLTGHQPQAKGNWHRYASSELYDTKDGKLMLGAANPGQHKRLMAALGLDHLAQASYEKRDEQRAAESTAIAAKLQEKTAPEWEAYLQERHVPAAVLRTMGEMLEDPQIRVRNILHLHENVPGVGKPVTVPVAAFKYAEGGPRVDTPPRQLGEDTDDILEGLGYGEEEIQALREAGAI